MRRMISTGFVLLAGIVGTPSGAEFRYVPSAAPGTQHDPRLTRLAEFFEEIDSPVVGLSAEFLAAADRHSLDWRLLPSIAVVESSGGKRYKNNNILGWDNGEKRFPSIRAGIHTVAARLANSRLYKKKGVRQILNTYNPRADYAPRVLRVMRAIGPAAPAYQN